MKNMGGGGRRVKGEGRRDYDWFGEGLIIRIRARCENSNLFENDKNVENFGLSFIVGEVWNYTYGIIDIVIFSSDKCCSGLIFIYICSNVVNKCCIFSIRYIEIVD